MVPRKEGKRLSWNFIVSALIGMILSYGGGSYLDSQSADPGLIFRIMGLVALSSALALFLILRSHRKRQKYPRLA